MSTESILKNVEINDRKSARKFVNALEEASNKSFRKYPLRKNVKIEFGSNHSVLSKLLRKEA